MGMPTGNPYVKKLILKFRKTESLRRTFVFLSPDLATNK